MCDFQKGGPSETSPNKRRHQLGALIDGCVASNNQLNTLNTLGQSRERTRNLDT
ncbi:hypothetical protein KB1_23590 [Cutibacterium modestum]|uniref:Uncharacterized protein n=1 Tax=Cutibacterium modestum TaxID=2559073 RepID=A0AAD1KSG1_9ACTN|nr:hypothetical protein KB1_23590 [Cutibacterium modestum]